MLLRNKQTGEITEANDWNIMQEYKSLAELNEEWEDYEEPDEYWYINIRGEICSASRSDNYWNREKAIGNCFETKEEAEKAVEKLKAWKRLREAGVEFYGWRRNQTGTYELYMRWADRIPRSYEVKKDLDLLFGGEE